MKENTGHIHPLMRTIDEIVRIFVDLGFEVALGPEIETEYYNFDALNVPKDHPSRDAQDTFWIKGATETVLRSHTSGVQVHYMEKQKPPFRIVVPGKVYRCESTDATHGAQFNQIEGLVVGENINLGNLKWTLETFLKKFLGDTAKMRMRPNFFPFTEPSLEIDVSCFLCNQRGCRVCKYSGWIEILGAGMVHPNVLRAGGIDPSVYRGFAFGAGIDRLVMIKYGIEDVRLLYAGDLRLVNQF